MKGRVLGGRYTLEKRVGEGGMGVVYKGRDRVTDEVVAVKIIRSDIACEARAVQRFFREAKAASSLAHPSIVRVLDEGTDTEHYIVMEYVDGVTIREWVRTFGRAPRTLIPVLGDILHALNHAHSRGIVHRDIKPENIIVTPDRRAKLMDFGLARPMNVRGVTITQEGAVVGTVAYMSPEQASGKRGDERSDLYSFGVVAYELFSGKRPFSSDSPMNVLIKHIQEEPVPPRRHNPGLLPAVEEVILRLLAKRPEDRYPGAMQALDAFKTAMEQTSARRARVETPEAAPEATPTPALPTPAPAASATPRPRRVTPLRTPILPGGILPSRRPAAESGPEPETLTEVAVLYTRVQMLQELLDQSHPLDAFDVVGMYERTVEAIAAISRGRVLEGSGPMHVLLFDGSIVQNPVACAVKAVKRLKEEVGLLAERSGCPEVQGNASSLFLSAGIFTAMVRPMKDGSVDEPVRRDLLNAARRLHDLSAAERKYCMLCEASWERVKTELQPEAAPFKRVYVSGRPQPLQVYEFVGGGQSGGREVGVAG